MPVFCQSNATTVLACTRGYYRFISGRGRSRVGRNQLTSKREQELEQRIKELQALQYQQPPRKQGFLDIIKEGALHGVGWAFAQRLVDSIFGPRSIQFFNPSDGDNGTPPPPTDTFSNSDNSEFLDDGGNGDNGDSGWGFGLDEFLDDE